jgi:hypothetical protein
VTARTDVAKRKAMERLQQFVGQFSDTDAGQNARRMLGSKESP